MLVENRYNLFVGSIRSCMGVRGETKVLQDIVGVKGDSVYFTRLSREEKMGPILNILGIKTL